MTKPARIASRVAAATIRLLHGIPRLWPSRVPGLLPAGRSTSHRCRAHPIPALSPRNYEETEQDSDWWLNKITPELAEFIAERDSFYLGTANGEGQPYIQLRGGPKGFLKVLDDRTLAFADFSGNRQYISYGNLNDNDKAFIFLMDYTNRKRIKVWGAAKVVEDDPELMQQLKDPNYRGKPERAWFLDVFSGTLRRGC